MTVLDIIKSARRLLNIDAVGDACSNAEAQNTLSILNLMMDNWKTQQFAMYMIKTSPFVVASNTASYTIGYGGTWDTTPDQRPVRIESAFCRSTSGILNVDFKMVQISNKNYQDLPLKGFTTSYPTHFLYVPDYPFGVITLYPVPGAVLTAYLSMWSQFETFSELSDEIELPPGYLQAIKYNLAVEMSPEYGVPDGVLGRVRPLAEKYLDDIKRVNQEPRYMKFDSALINGGGRFSILQGF
jgi:hypothetical protein